MIQDARAVVEILALHINITAIAESRTDGLLEIP